MDVICPFGECATDLLRCSIVGFVDSHHPDSVFIFFTQVEAVTIRHFTGISCFLIVTPPAPDGISRLEIKSLAPTYIDCFYFLS